ncbi:hypothetical protein DFA_08828 [Cavenderia fasciculata]|uniref:Leucine-rich repeat-containing protein n=1 Tax=Cavenderia fasciculata TaxID=261658 RepID=F4Q4H8_CACFS|nr:uncharacterized protein DFA_08828 [Cavenderia fasciculata]EGG17827.1 hypothetical protein DFA_08828 [Cavenderia fasciculata]|eukprot:XP_004356311.1 hypothetical protein DFA_08828 [Cavenderia fasciculata]
MKNNCPTHFSHTRPYKPLAHDLKSSNQSKLQLTLINKDIFNYISQNCFTVIKLECYQYEGTVEKHGNNAYCVALKHFTTITSDCSHDNDIPKSLHKIDKDKLEQITKVVFYNGDCLQDLIKLLPNLTCIDFSKKEMGGFRELSLENLSKLKSLTKLDLSGVSLQRDGSKHLAEIKNLPLKKLCLPSWDPSLYNGLPAKLKRSITKITADPYMDLSVFPNVNHILITERDTSRWRLPQTVTKVSSKYLEIGFLPHNRQVTKFKTYYMFTNQQKVHTFLKTLSDQCHHVKTVIRYGNCPLNIPNDLFDSFNYRIDYSWSSMEGNSHHYASSQYLRLERINYQPIIIDSHIDIEHHDNDIEYRDNEQQQPDH